MATARGLLGTLILVALSVAAPLRAETVVPSSQSQITLSFTPVVKAAAPAVVNIYATVVVQRRQSMFAADPFFDQLFRDFGQVTPQIENSLGSGVIVSPDGLVVSNHHVVGQATEIRVVLNDGREYLADVLLADQQSDLAVLQLQGAEDLPALPFRNSDEVEVGELVLAIGNPFGLGQTVSSGIVSGLARSVASVGDGRGYFLQTDAAINPGNSGGALVDMAGRLVGINTAILTRSGGSNGIGFAIPANLVASVVDQAKAGETRFRRPWAGVTGQEVDAGLAEALGLDRPEGVILHSLHPASPFAAAGMVAGDVILSLGGQMTNSPQEVIFRMSAAGIGSELQVIYLRDGTRREAAVRLIAPPEDPPREAVTITGENWFRGLSVARINPAVQAEMDLPPSSEGVVVTDVQDLAARTGLRPGDILLAIADQPILTTADVARATQSTQRFWRVDILRGGQRIGMRFRL
ncbi:Do family serine endopeptidase [Aliigemmobacter aestuarii]|uniref:Do family serine endopeptidase n=1 Tax=Aliigemmobacter aestuarii TaxID=1445661 RepID=A0A4S3MRN3_9RHOB|nr:Do family serine endopeptidase [Gemmobacter aestuarii]THD85210.1 Do family serine endopeptidase [Gemmobacter aestuarii]